MYLHKTPSDDLKEYSLEVEQAKWLEERYFDKQMFIISKLLGS